MIKIRSFQSNAPICFASVQLSYASKFISMLIPMLIKLNILQKYGCTQY